MSSVTDIVREWNHHRIKWTISNGLLLPEVGKIDTEHCGAAGKNFSTVHRLKCINAVWLNENCTSNLPGLAFRSSWLLESSCQALARRDEGMPFLQRILSWDQTHTTVLQTQAEVSCNYTPCMINTVTHSDNKHDHDYTLRQKTGLQLHTLTTPSHSCTPRMLNTIIHSDNKHNWSYTNTTHNCSYILWQHLTTITHSICSTQSHTQITDMTTVTLWNFPPGSTKFILILHTLAT